MEVCIATETLRSGGRSYTVHAQGDENGTQVVLSRVLCSCHEKFPPPQPLKCSSSPHGAGGEGNGARAVGDGVRSSHHVKPPLQEGSKA